MYDLAIVGGGLGGSALAAVIARAGYRVLVVERERKFRDRNRGEGMHPWGVAEARALGIEGRLLETCGSPIRWRNVYERGALVGRRDMVAAGGHPGMDFHHPEMQEVMLDLARESGAEVRRGVAVTGVQPGRPPSVNLEDGARITAGLVVGADGRTSRVREWAGLPARRDPECLVIAGVLYGGLDLSSDAFHVSFDFGRGQSAQFFPLRGDRFRCYFFYAREGPPRPLQGARHTADFVAACVETGAALPLPGSRARRCSGPSLRSRAPTAGWSIRTGTGSRSSATPPHRATPASAAVSPSPCEMSARSAIGFSRRPTGPGRGRPTPRSTRVTTARCVASWAGAARSCSSGDPSPSRGGPARFRCSRRSPSEGQIF